jgi:hypothetical protein
MLTLFSVPRKWEGHIGDIQWNALSSWKRLHPDLEIIVIGDEGGTAEACLALGVEHESSVGRTAFGTPMVSSIFKLARERSRNSLQAYVNADIVLCHDFMDAVTHHIHRQDVPSMLFGRRTNIDIVGRMPFETGWEEKVRALGTRTGYRSPGGADYFVFSRDLYKEIPAFALGRGAWDIWLIHAALSTKADVMDASQIVDAWHQNHDYDHLPPEIQKDHPRGRRDWTNKGLESAYNRALVMDPTWLSPYHDLVRVLSNGSAE